MIFNKNILLSISVLLSFSVMPQESIQKLKLRQSFVDSMHIETREHIVIDSLTNYYRKFDATQLNQAQKDLVFYSNFCDSLFEYDFVDLITNHSDFILERTKSVILRVQCDSTLAAIDSFQKLCLEIEPYLPEENLDSINEFSANLDQELISKIYYVILELDMWICWLPRDKVLSVYDYIARNKTLLYE